MGGSLASRGPIADINVTPLIDVVLVLLVVFMVITPMMQSGMTVDLPKATMTTTVNDVGQHIVISVTNDKGLWVEQTSTTLEELIYEVNQEVRTNPDRTILIKADTNLEYQTVRDVMDVLAESGRTSVFVAAAKEN